jgi:hypothetical protein
VDIAILETTFSATQPFSIEVENDKAALTFCQPVWFLGYPFLEGLGTKFRRDAGATMPFIKKGILSAIDASNPDAVLLYVDGFNNHGSPADPFCTTTLGFIGTS